MRQIVSTAFILAFGCSAFADSASVVNSANKLVREGQVGEAVEMYRSVEPTDSIGDELDYNLAVAYYRQGELESARSMFTEVAASSRTKLAAAARYNLGNCFYSEALSLAESDRPAAIEALQNAIGHYRGSLASNPDNVDARANIELAVQLLKQFEEQQQQQQADGEQSQDDQSESDQQDGDQQTQDQSGQESESEDQQGDQTQSESDDSEGDESKSEQEQSGSEDQSSDSSSSEEQQSEDGGQPQDSESQSEQDESATESASEQSAQQQQAQQKQTAQQRSNAQEPSDAAPGEDSEDEADEEPVPSGELKAVSEHEAIEDSSDQAAFGSPSKENAPMSREEALKMLQAVRDRDMLRRLRQEQIERKRHVPTDRDW